MDIEQTLAQLDLSQKIKLLCGLGWWQTEAIPEVSIPSIKLSDGPNGVRGQKFFNGVPASCFPASTGLGSAFDVELARKVGEALADEAIAKGCHVLLGPTVNTPRSPLGGRGFESFSEDPTLNGTIASAYIQGLQSKGVSATIKHFVANDQETQRFSISSNVNERALREIYLKPFQIAIREAKPWALMTAYNRVNGVHASENSKLLKDILREEWCYEGLIMSDYTGVYSTTESLKAGLDLEMPGPTVMRGKAVERAIMGGKLFPSDIDTRVRKILELVKHAQASGIPFNVPEKSIDTPQLRQLLRQAAADAIVLLKNNNNVLPLSKNVKTIAVIGPNAKLAQTSGGGSARLLSTYTVSPLEGIMTAAAQVGAKVKYTIGAASHRYLPLLDTYIKQLNRNTPGATLEFWNDPPSRDFLLPEANIEAPLSKCKWSTETLGTNCLLLDGIDAAQVNHICFIRYITAFVPDESGDWEFGVYFGGKGNLFLDKKLIVDLSTNPEPGEEFFGLATQEKRAVVTGLKAGTSYEMELRINTADFVAKSPLPCWGCLRIGGVRQFDGQAAILDAVELAKNSDVAILVIGLNHDWESEGFDRSNMDLPLLTNDLVTAILRANPNTVVVNNSGTPVAMPWIDEAPTLLQQFYGGNECGNALADILWGKVNPSAKLSLSFPKRVEDTPCYGSFGASGQEHGKIQYNEGIYVGYRSYELRKLAPLFPFGYGQSYSSFEYSDLQVPSTLSAVGTFSVTFKIRNTSAIFGREVAQIYIADPDSSLPRPMKELKGFHKVSLESGETKPVTVSLNREALGFYDDRQMCWVAEKGAFEILIASSSADVKLKAKVTLEETIVWTGL
ncbi:putative beta-glucosidase I [Favolaschia claudopus]|uniref:beta-glucosidase n=1 Tax=Favolaschia claudopus TaxID=2862362 RepID=A0AAV9ZFB4_9AGAR